MTAEPFIALLLIWQLRRINKRSFVRPEWDKPLRNAMFTVLGIMVFQAVLPDLLTTWLWHVAMVLFIIAIFKMEELQAIRNLAIAFLPLMAVALLKDIVGLLPESIEHKFDGYLNFAFPASVIWMIVMLIIFNKQRKALEKEHRKTEDEEQQKKIAEARKAELEVLVAERTSEILQQKNELERTIEELRNTQSQLIQSEKMASLGALTAGIAHEIQNPLNFVNNFSEVNTELIEELKAEHLKPGSERSVQHEQQLLNDISENEQKIIHHGKRADAIVKGMLLHSRISTGQKEPTDINAVVDEYLRLSYHGLRAKDKTFNAKYEANLDETIGQIKIVPQDIGRVLLNLFNNAFYAVTEKKKENVSGYEPTVTVTTKQIETNIAADIGQREGGVLVTVADNGNGIPDDVLKKIFQPFFTTKPPGEGTGLGLSLSYDIVRAHGGEIRVETAPGEGSKFTIALPRDQS